LKKAQKHPYKLITTKSVFLISILVVIITVIGVMFWGVGHNKNLYQDSVISTSILSIIFFLFIAIGLYNGVKLKDNLGRIVDKFDAKDIPDISNAMSGSGFTDGADGIIELIISFVLWLVVAIILSLLLWVFSAVVWLLILVFATMLYWIFFRALRLIFKNSVKCKNNFQSSFLYAVLYTFFYTSWIYGIIFLTYYFKEIKN
jgi:hypothetical protein